MEKLNLFILHPEEKLSQNLAQFFPGQIADCHISNYRDGEIRFENKTSIRNGKCFIIQSMSHPVNERLMETLIVIDALKRASAGEINVVAPYLGYTRQDRKARPRQAITARLVADLLETAGADRLITFDLHAPQIEGFYSIPVDNLSTTALFHLFLEKAGLLNDLPVVVATDHGGAVRARRMADLMGAKVAIIDKRREKDNEVVSMQIIGDIQNQNCLVIDDLIDTGDTLMKAASLLKENGARKIIACCSHGVLSQDAVARLKNSLIDHLFLTNSIDKAYEFGSNNVVDLAHYLAAVIHCIVEGEAVSESIDIHEML